MPFPLFLVVFFFFLAASNAADAQVLDKIGRKIERKATDRVNRKIDKTIDKGLDKVEDALDDSVKGEDKKSQAPPSGQSDKKSGSPKPSDLEAAPEAEGQKQNKGSESEGEESKTATFAAYSKYDFVPGEKIIALEDFSKDEIGDFPAKWNTNASGEIVRLDGSDAKWLAFTSSGVLIPEFITQLPENFTIEFDMAVSPTYSFYDQPLLVSVAELKNPNEFTSWGRFGNGRSNGVLFSFHPQDAGSAPLGIMGFEVWGNSKVVMQNSKGQLSSFSKVKNFAKVAVWRQKQRVRVYVNGEKIWDLPRAFANEVAYNGLVFGRQDAKPDNKFFITNLRLAVGAPDTRHKLIEEGKFATTGIYFTSGSAVIKPESYGVLKEIATVLKENSAVKVVVIGHTDSDGSDELNLKLSKDRAAAVMATLEKEFGIEPGRLESDGKGASEPVGDNLKSEGKAANRRVEFVKKS